jgi:hypothetical protein
MCAFINPIFTMLIISLCPKDILYAILLMPLGTLQHSQHTWKNEFVWFSSSLWQQRKEKNHIYNLILFFIFLVVALHTFVKKWISSFIFNCDYPIQREDQKIHVGECINEWIDFNFSAILCKTYNSIFVLRSIKI